MATNPSDLKRVETFVAEFPDLFDNAQQIYNTWADRETNGCERAKAIVKFRKRLMINTPLMVEWIVNGERSAA